MAGAGNRTGWRRGGRRTRELDDRPAELWNSFGKGSPNNRVLRVKTAPDTLADMAINADSIELWTWQGHGFDPVHGRIDRSKSEFWADQACRNIRQAYTELDRLLGLPKEDEHQFIWCDTNATHHLPTAALYAMISPALERSGEGPSSKRAVRANANGQIIGARMLIAFIGIRAMNLRKLWPNILTIVGGIGLVVGAIDPMEGSLVILPGSGLLALGAYLGQAERRMIAYRVGAFVLIAIGVAALWGFSAVGGFGGSSGRSMWWGTLILPYLIGWNMGIWGPGSPRWLSWLGLGNGLWYLAMAGIIVKQKRLNWEFIVVFLATIGIVALAGCIYRLVKQMKTKEMATNVMT